MSTTKKYVSIVAATAAISLAVATGCNPQPEHPNQIDAFDGATYDTLTLAHAALNVLQDRIATNYRQYIPVFNEAAAAYSSAFTAYSIFRSNQNIQSSVTVAMGSLTVSIVALESAIETDLHVSPATVVALRGKAAKIRDSAGVNPAIADLLTELELASSMAATIDGSQPYADLAATVVNATQQALAAENAAAGQPIDLSTIQPIPPIY